MVREANVKQAAAEKQLKEAQGKVCEVISALQLKVSRMFYELTSCPIKIPQQRPNSFCLKIGCCSNNGHK